MTILKTISTIALAEILGERHYQVTRKVRKMLDKCGLNIKDFSEVRKCGNNNTHVVFNLPEAEMLEFASGYDVKTRAKIIKEWSERCNTNCESVEDKMERLFTSADWICKMLNLKGKDKLDIVRKTIAIAHPESLKLIDKYIASEYYHENY